MANKGLAYSVDFVTINECQVGWTADVLVVFAFLEAAFGCCAGCRVLYLNWTTVAIKEPINYIP